MSENDSNPKPKDEPVPAVPSSVSANPAVSPALGAFPPPSRARVPGKSPPVEAPPVVDVPPVATAPADVEATPSLAKMPPEPLHGSEALPAVETLPTVQALPVIETLPTVQALPAIEASSRRAPRLLERAARAVLLVLRRAKAPPVVEAPPAEAPPAVEAPAPDASPAEVMPSMATKDASAELTSRVVVLLMVTSLVMVVFHMQPSSRENANTGSRYATIEALVDQGTWNIDKTNYVFTPDKVKAKGHFVSSKPPLLPTYGAGVYFLLKKITGYNIADNEGIVVWVVGLFTGWLSHLVFLVYFYRLSRLLLVRQLAILILMAAACFAYLGVAYATAINNHSPGAALAIVGFYYAYRARHGLGGNSAYLLAGFWLGVLPAIDLSSAAATAFLAVYLGTRDLKRTLLLYVPATFPGLGSQLLLAHSATGSWIPAYADTGLMQYAGSYFGGRRSGIDALNEPKAVYAFHVLLGHHGLFSMTPIFCFSAFELVRRLVRRDKYMAETAVFLASVTVVCAFYIFRTHNYGGWCVGMRWLVPIMPWLLVAFGLWLDRATMGRLKWSLVVVAFAVSAFNVQDGLTSPFQFSLWHNFLDGEPNRNRLGPKWNLSRPQKQPDTRHGRPPPSRPRPHPAPTPAGQ
jgi:hypothetical protein